ncbi:hypothetical protein GCM10023083_75440 [Streptomyces phyllanthi]
MWSWAHPAARRVLPRVIAGRAVTYHGTETHTVRTLLTAFCLSSRPGCAVALSTTLSRVVAAAA